MLHLRLINKAILLTLLLLFIGAHADGKKRIRIRHSKKSKSYIEDYYKKYLIVRAFESTKFTNFRFSDGGSKLIYKPNEHNNAGVGINYKFISLNLGFHVPFTDKDQDRYGKTRQLDLQTHIYARKFIIDFFGQFYKGYYLFNPDIRANYLPSDVIKRPDIRTRDISLMVQYVFNYDHFSYNAPLYQNEVQKKSAGSFIAGGGIYHSHVRADSSLVPRDINDSAFFNGSRFNIASHIGLGISAGYGYTFVIHKRFFVTAMASAGAGLGYSYTSAPGEGRTSAFGPEYDLNLKCAAGYNYGKYFAGVNYIRLITTANSAFPDTWQEVNRGNFRVIVAKRLKHRRSLLPKSGVIKVD